MSETRLEGLPEGWELRSISVASADRKLNLFVNQFVRTNIAGAARVLFIVHGQGEHGARYSHFPHYLNDSVDAVICMDHRGHGRSQGARGHVDHFEDYVEDAYSVLQATVLEFTSRDTGRPPKIHLFGHSMGGLISLLMLQQKSVVFLKSATISAPLLELKYPVPAIKKAAGHILSQFLGGLQMETGLDASLISHDPEVVQAYLDDPLVHSKATTRFFTEMTGAIKVARSRASGISVPIKFIIPMADGLVSPQAALEFYSRLENPNKSLTKLDGFYHESFNELEKQRAFDELRSWIKSH